MSEYQQMMRWRLILKEFGPNIHQIDAVDNILADTLNILSSTLVDKYDPITSKAQFCANKLWQGRRKTGFFPLNILSVQIEQK